jgi:hypothetical protein
MTKDMDDITRTIQFNPSLEAYTGFFCDEWKHCFLKTTRTSRLRDHGFDLARTWEAISNARQLPWLMAKCLDSDSCEKLDSYEPWNCRKIRILGNKLVARLEKLGERIRPMFRNRLNKAIKELGEEIDTMRSDSAARVLEKRDDIWEMLMEQHVFLTSLWGLERMSYGGLYYGYEWYLCQCLRLKTGQLQHRWEAKSRKEFRSEFGSDLAKSCLEDAEIQLARVTRNALVHNGGRTTPELNKLSHTFIIEGGEIQINAEHTTSLFHKLKDRVIELTRVAVTLPEFQTEGTKEVGSE